MANIRKTFNFRNGVQVDEDNFLVNSVGLVIEPCLLYDGPISLLFAPGRHSAGRVPTVECGTTAGTPATVGNLAAARQI